jgi:signal transduction histidine kinase
MAYALHARTEYIREFATHISHEFKTPLHGIRQSTEQLRESSGDTTKQHRNQLLNAITKDNDRLDRLISRLLELARADNITPSGESCYLMPIVKRLAEQFSNNQFHVQIEGEEHYDAPLPADSFDSVITILLENARQHGAKTVHINMHIEEQEMTLRIINDGDAISPDDAEKIFLPFFSTQREKGGIGLGLGIARSLLEAYGGTLQYQPDAEHTTFMLTVPILP